MTMDEIYEKVADLLNMTTNEVKENCKKIDDIDAYYFWNSNRGGCSLIINEAGEKLGASSAVSFEKHINAYKSGKRN